MSRLQDELDAWRRTLANKPALAEATIERVISKRRRSSVSDPYEMSRVISQLKNGSSTPEDSGVRQ